MIHTVQNQIQIAQLQQQTELAAQQAAMLAEQNQLLAEMQAAEEEERRQVAAFAKREAGLKQFLFGVNQSLDDLAEIGDEVSMLAQADYFREKVAHYSFSPNDLSQIGDKKYFLDTTRRVDAVLEQGSEKSRANFQKFKALHAQYKESFEGRSVFPEADSAGFRQKPQLTTFPKPKPALTELAEHTLNTLVTPSEELIALRRKSEVLVWGLVGCMAGNVLLPGIAFIPAACIYFFGLRPAKLARQPMEDQFQKELEEAKRLRLEQHTAKHQRAVEAWEREKQKFEKNLSQANREIEDHNRTLKQRFDAAQSEWLARKRKLSETINSYIDRHPTLQTWFPRPASVEVDQRNADLRKTFKIE